MEQFKASRNRFRKAAYALSLLWIIFSVIQVLAQGSKLGTDDAPPPDKDADHVKARAAWFLRGRVVPKDSAAELRRRAFETKIRMRAARIRAGGAESMGRPGASGSWTPLGPLPLASDATGSGIQDYHQVAGRATSVAVDPADPSGNTVYVGGAQGGLWKSTDGANGVASNVTWSPVTDDQATLSIGSIVIQPGNTNSTKSLILVGTGEADNSSDSYFGLGILRSTDSGSTWALIGTANNGALSFGGLGGTHMAFSTASGQTNTVVAAMATTSEGMIDGAVTGNTSRGLYTSTDAGQTWNYNILLDPGNLPTDATSSTAIVYNTVAGRFFAAVRYHGFYSSPNGVTWTRLPSQPAGTLLSSAACPPLSTTNFQACPIYRGEITVVPGRNEMYTWFVSLDSNGNAIDRGIWQSLTGGTTWVQISETGISNCGDQSGCGVEQGYYNLELLAVPNGASATDLYAGAINIYKCSISSANPTCASPSFLNLTHVYGCFPLAAPSHVHPDQHGIAYMIPTAGSDTGNALMYFANDGGLYRALDGFLGLNTGSCSGTNQFDDLNQNLGSMAQFVSFSQHPTDTSTLLGGTQDNGSPATTTAGTNTGWENVLGGDGGYNAIDPSAPSNWFTSNPDIGGGSLNILECSAGSNCNEGGFTAVVSSADLGGDDGAFYFPYILDPQSATALLAGSCRVWRGPRLGGAYTVLSPNFDTFGSGLCTGREVNTVRALAVGGPRDSNGFSNVIYATTDGLGPLDGVQVSPPGGHVWVTTNAAAGTSSFTEVSQDINPNQFPISSVVMDTSDSSGSTAYVTVMGFTGGPGHVWKTVDAGVNWTDFTGTSSALPDSPVNAVAVDASAHSIYVGTDVGVFQSSTVTAGWTEVGPASGSGQAGFLPNVAVTALGLFTSSGQKLLRASTYGRGVWQFDLLAKPDFRVAISNTPLTTFPGLIAGFNGTLTSLNGYTNSVALTCTAGTTSPPPGCAVNPSNLPPTPNGAAFTVTVPGGVTPQDYDFNVHAVGSDAGSITHDAAVILQVVNFGLTVPSPNTVSVARGTTSTPVNFQITAEGSFNQTVSVSCSPTIPGATCTLTPGQTVSPTSTAPVDMTASVAVPLGTVPDDYLVEIQASTQGAPAPLSTSFSLSVSSNPDFVLTESGAFPEVNTGSSNVSGPITISSQDGFSGTVGLSCSFTAGGGSCGISPTSVSSLPATATITVNAMTVPAGKYQFTVTGTSGSMTHQLTVPFNVGDYLLAGTKSITVSPGQQAAASLTLTSLDSYSGKVTVTCMLNMPSGTICNLAPASPIPVNPGAITPVTASVSVPNNALPGAYSITINTQDSTGTPAHAMVIPATIIQDFVVSSSTLSQTVNTGQTSGPYNLTIQPVGASFTGAVTLSCGGLPALAQCLFNPAAPITPGSNSASVVLTISTSPAVAFAPAPQLKPGGLVYILALALPSFLLVWGGARGECRKTRGRFVATGMLVMLAAVSISCGGASNGNANTGGGGNEGTKTGQYQITVTGTSGTLQHSTSVTLIVQ